MAVFMFPYLFRKEFFVPCLTGLQLCKDWNLSKGSNQTKGELLNTKAEGEIRLKDKHKTHCICHGWHLTGWVPNSKVQDGVRNCSLKEIEAKEV